MLCFQQYERKPVYFSCELTVNRIGLHAEADRLRIVRREPINRLILQLPLLTRRSYLEI